jgi:hypothetical protein
MGTLYQRLKAVMKPEDISSHESDLYVRWTPEAQAVINEWRRENGLMDGWGLCSWFTNQVEGGTWIDIPFAFDPFWEKTIGRVDPFASAPATIELQ